MAAAADDDGEKSAFRWIDAARLAVASVVLVLIVSVIVNAVKVVLRADSLSLTVVQGTVFVRRSSPPAPPSLTFDMDIRACNPSGRVRMYFTSFNGYLFDSSKSPWTSSNVEDLVNGCILYFDLFDKSVPQLRKVDMLKEVGNATRGNELDAPWFDKLYNGTGAAAIADVTMRLDGVVVTELRSDFNVTRINTTYSCEPLMIAVGDRNDEAYQNIQDVPCTVQNSLR